MELTLTHSLALSSLIDWTWLGCCCCCCYCHSSDWFISQDDSENERCVNRIRLYDPICPHWAENLISFVVQHLTASLVVAAATAAAAAAPLYNTTQQQCAPLQANSSKARATSFLSFPISDPQFYFLSKRLKSRGKIKKQNGRGQLETWVCVCVCLAVGPLSRLIDFPLSKE